MTLPQSAGAPPTGSESRALQPTSILTVAIAVVVGVVWLPSLGRSLWLDELISTWVISDGFGTAIERAQEYQASSPLYFALLWVWSQIAGTQEALLRLPSLACAIAAAWHLNGLGRDLGSPLAGRIAVLLTVSTPTVAQMSLSVRPYALLLLVVVASARYLLRWVDTRRLRDGVATGVLTALSLYLHPFSAFVFVAHLLYLGLVARSGRAPSKRQMGQVAALTAVLVVPLLPQLVQIAGRTDVYSYARMPDLDALAGAMAPPVALVLLMIGLGLSRRLEPLPQVSTHRYAFVATWAVASPVLLFAVSHLTGSSVFVQRYYMVATPGAALLLGLLYAAIANLTVRSWLVLALSSIVLIGAVVDSPLSGLERNWRSAIGQVNAVVVPDDTAVLFADGLVESNDPDWLGDPSRQPYLASIFSQYPVTAPTLALPTAYLPENAAHVERAVDAAARGAGTVVVLIPYVPGVNAYLAELDILLEAEGLTHQGQRDFTGLRVLRYER